MFEALLSNRTVSVLVEALPRILTAGLTMTIPLTLLSFFFAMIIAVAVALVQYANVPVLRQIARFYIWVIRGTPLLVQLFLCLQRGCLLRRDHARCAGKRAAGAAGGWVLCGHELVADHAPHRAAAGAAHRRACAV